MQNGIIINGTQYELVPVAENESECGDCALYEKCYKYDAYILCDIFESDGNDENLYHLKKKTT